MINELTVTLILLFILSPITYLAVRAISECSNFSEKERISWEQIRKTSKWYFALRPAIVTTIVYISTKYFVIRFIKNESPDIVDILNSSLFVGTAFCIGWLAKWRTNELKFLGKIPNKWKSNN